MTTGAQPLLELAGVETGFGSNQVLHGVDLSLAQGQTGVLFGLNGAGKSVTLRTISGLQRAWAGSVRLAGRELGRLEPEDRVRAGLGHVLQARGVFPHLTVAENLRLGGAVLKPKERYERNLERVYGIYPRLAERRKQLAGTLSGGEQAMLAVGRALVAGPYLLLVDEPSAGLAPLMVSQLYETLAAVKDGGIGLLIAEQNVGFGLQVADIVFVMEKGSVVYRDDAAHLDHRRVGNLLGVGDLLADDAAPGRHDQ